MEDYFKCDDCNSLFSSRNKLAKHRQIHIDYGIPAYNIIACLICNTKFVSLGKYSEHLKNGIPICQIEIFQKHKEETNGTYLGTAIPKPTVLCERAGLDEKTKYQILIKAISDKAVRSYKEKMDEQRVDFQTVIDGFNEKFSELMTVCKSKFIEFQTKYIDLTDAQISDFVTGSLSKVSKTQPNEPTSERVDASIQTDKEQLDDELLKIEPEHKILNESSDIASEKKQINDQVCIEIKNKLANESKDIDIEDESVIEQGEAENEYINERQVPSIIKDKDHDNTTCHKCNTIFRTKYGLEKHIIRKNDCSIPLNSIECRTCTDCNKVFSSVASYRYHTDGRCRKARKKIMSELENIKKQLVMN